MPTCRRCLLVVLLALTACQRGSNASHEQLHVFGSITDIEIRGSTPEVAKLAIADASALLLAREHEWHPWQPSDLTRINAAFRAGQPAPAPDSILDLVRRSQAYARLSDGLFDPAIGGLVALWGFHTSAFPVTTPAPGADQVAAWLQSRPRIADISIQGKQLSSRNPTVELDFNAIAEGEAAGMLVALFRQRGIRHALISLGGDVMALGDGDGRPWDVGMKDPYGGALGSVELGDGEAFFTSGNYNKFRETSNGGRWGHILDPRTGMPARGAAATAVLIDDPVLADAASTALMVAGPAGFKHTVESMRLGCALMVTEENELLITRGMDARMRFLREPVRLGQPVDTGARCATAAAAMAMAVATP